MHRALLLSVIAALWAAPAQAAFVSVGHTPGGSYLSVFGGPEADALTVSSPAPGTYLVAQRPGVPLIAQWPCAASGPGKVTCRTAALDGVYATGGGGDDSLTVASAIGQGALMFGGPGDDVLRGGPGADQLEGGAGADVIHSRDGVRDRVACGSERDTVDGDAGDDIAADCEARQLAPGRPAAPAGPAPVDVAPGRLTLAKGSVSLRVSCAAEAGARCRGWVTLRLRVPAKAAAASATHAKRKAKATVIGRRRYSVRAGHAKVLKVHISRRGRIRVLKRRRAQCSVAVMSVASDGTKQVRRRTVTITTGKAR